VILEICRSIREEIGSEYPLLIKMNCRDFTETGLTLEDAVAAGKRLAEAGIDAIEVSGGLLTDSKLSPSRQGIVSEEKEAYFGEEARSLRKETGLPIILVGGIRSFEVAERVVTDGTADFVSMCRPLIREPGLIARWKSGDLRKADCKSDNLCFRPGFSGEGVYCMTEKREKENR
jgi:2,4-dienoyl-CoA reductase-like NADH-dependent reductase (Old Yellow Enzyme family)